MMKKKVLIVDDDKDILMMLAESLRIEGYLPLTAENGKTALSSLSQNRVDIILLDVMLPDIDGRLLCKKIRAEFDIPIIMVSAKDRIEDRVTGLDSGADDYMIKPFSTLELASRIRANLRRYRSKKTFSSDTLEINLAEHIITKDKNPIDLTQKQWDIMEYLLKHNKKACSRKEIISAVWGDSLLYKWSRVLDVHIQHLREKIEDNPKNPLHIKTVPGVGYKAVF